MQKSLFACDSSTLVNAALKEGKSKEALDFLDKSILNTLIPELGVIEKKSGSISNPSFADLPIPICVQSRGDSSKGLHSRGDIYKGFISRNDPTHFGISVVFKVSARLAVKRKEEEVEKELGPVVSDVLA